MLRIWIALTLLLSLTLATGCASSTSSADEATEPATDAALDASADGSSDTPDEEAVPVEVVELRTGRIESVLKSSTNLEAERAVGIYAQTTGLVTALMVEEGDRVPEGQVLLQIEDDEQRSAVLKAEAELEKQRRELSRLTKLFEDSLVSEQELGDQDHVVRQLEIDLDDARRNLRYTTVRAPIAGTITRRLVNRGERVLSAAHLFNMVDFDSLVARVYLPEKDLRSLRLGQRASLRAKALGDVDYSGEVKRISPIVDARSGTVKVTVAVDAARSLRPGMFVDARIVTATHDDALLVPKRCLVYDRERTYVFRIDDALRAERVFVDASLEDRDHIEPREGLAAGDVLVAAGQVSLKPGALVEILGGAGDDAASGSESAGTEIARALQ